VVGETQLRNPHTVVTESPLIRTISDVRCDLEPDYSTGVIQRLYEWYTARFEEDFGEKHGEITLKCTRKCIE
jgi:hypothetical protein